MGNTYASVCPGCGGSAIPGTNICEYCGKELFITTFSTVDGMNYAEINKYMANYNNSAQGSNVNKENALFALGLCQLKLKLYEKAETNFSEVCSLKFDNAEAYFYQSICVLKGKRPYFSNIQQINKAEELLNAALSFQQKGIYYYYEAYIKSDFYEKKCFKTDKDSATLVAEAKKYGVTSGDKTMLEEIFNSRIVL